MSIIQSPLLYSLAVWHIIQLLSVALRESKKNEPKPEFCLSNLYKLQVRSILRPLQLSRAPAHAAAGGAPSQLGLYALDFGTELKRSLSCFFLPSTGPKGGCASRLWRRARSFSSWRVSAEHLTSSMIRLKDVQVLAQYHRSESKLVRQRWSLLTILGLRAQIYITTARFDPKRRPP